MTTLLSDDPPFTPVISLIAMPVGSFGAKQFVIPEAGAGGVPLSRLSQPQNEGSVTLREPSANDWAEASLGGLTNKVGMFVSNVPYVRSGSSVLQNTGGQLDATVAYGAAVIGADTRAFLYATDRETPTQAVPITATAAGQAHVSETIRTITTVNDINMVVATNTLLAAVNLNRSEIIIQNVSGTATDINRIGDTNITGSRGIQIVPGETVRLKTTAAVFGRPEAGNGPMTVTELIN